MARLQKVVEGAIFPIHPLKKKLGHETENNKNTTELKIDEASTIIKDTDGGIVNNEQFTPRPFIEDSAIVDSQISMRDVGAYDEVAAEEIVVKIVEELSRSEDLINTLSNAIAKRLSEQLNTHEIITFISKNKVDSDNPEHVYFKEHLLKYMVLLQEQISASIKQTTSNLLTRDY